MAEVKVKYTCGCGYSTHDPEEAISHVDKNGHAMDIHGTIRPES